MGATEAASVTQPLVRPMQPADAEAALALSQEAGWNQTADDWRFMLGEGRALGVYEPGRGWVASSPPPSAHCSGARRASSATRARPAGSTMRAS